MVQGTIKKKVCHMVPFALKYSHRCKNECGLKSTTAKLISSVQQVPRKKISKFQTNNISLDKTPYTQLRPACLHDKSIRSFVIISS